MTTPSTSGPAGEQPPENGAELIRVLRELQEETWPQSIGRVSRSIVESSVDFLRAAFQLTPEDADPVVISPYSGDHGDQVTTTRAEVADTGAHTQASSTPAKSQTPKRTDRKTELLEKEVQTVSRTRSSWRGERPVWHDTPPGLSAQHPYLPSLRQHRHQPHPSAGTTPRQPSSRLPASVDRGVQTRPTGAELKYASSSRAEGKGASSSRAEVKGPSSSRAEVKGPSSSRAEVKGPSSSRAEVKGASSSGSQVKDASSKAELKAASSSSLARHASSPSVKEAAAQTEAPREVRVAAKPQPSGGYSCRSCGGVEKTRPHLFLATHACFSTPSMLNVTVFIHDDRLKDYLVRQKLESRNASIEQLEEVDLLDSYHDSRLYVRLRLPKNSRLQHCMDDSRRPLLSVEKSYQLHRLLSCRKCQKKERQTPPPISQKWMLEPAGAGAGGGGLPVQPSPHFHAVIDICHLHADQPYPVWDTELDYVHSVTSVAFHVECPWSMDKPEDRSSWEKHLCDLNERQLERVARALDITDAQIQSLRHRCGRSEDFCQQLREACMRQGTTGSGLFIPAIAGLVSEESRLSRLVDTITSLSHDTERHVRPSGFGHTLPPYSGTRINNDLSVVRAGIEYRQCSFPSYHTQAESVPPVPGEDQASSIHKDDFSDSTRMPYLKSFAETDLQPSYYSHFSAANLEDHSLEDNELVSSLSGRQMGLPDSKDRFQTATDLPVMLRDSHAETEISCREWQGPRVDQLSTAAISQCNIVGRALSFGEPIDVSRERPSSEIVSLAGGTGAINYSEVNVETSPGQRYPQKTYDGSTSLRSRSSTSLHELESLSSWSVISLASDAASEHPIANPSDPEDSSHSSLNSPSLPNSSDPRLTQLNRLELGGAHTVFNDLSSPLSLVSSDHSTASSACIEFTISLSDTDNTSQEPRGTDLPPDKRNQTLTELLKKFSETSAGNMLVSCGTTSTQTEPQKKPVSPIVCSQWQTCLEFTNEGGCLQTDDSDVRLHVPPEAVQSGSSVEVFAAICANVDQIRHILQLSEEEEILSPLAEYCTSGNVCFHRQVSIILPHALPTGYDVTQVNVYRVSHSENGNVAVTKLKQPQFPYSEPESPGQPHSLPPSFYFSSPGQICIRTDRFSGYTCTYSSCSLQQDSPVLHAMVCSTQSKDVDGQEVDIFTYVWDDRLTIKDFQKENGIGTRRKIKGSTVLPLMEDINNTKLCFCLQLLGRGARNWMRMQSSGPSTDDPFPFLQSIGIQRVLSCDNENCKARKVCSQPVEIKWVLETADHCLPSDPVTLKCAVLVSHVPSATSLSECFQDKSTMETFYVQVKDEDDEHRPEPDERRHPRRRIRIYRSRDLEPRRWHDCSAEGPKQNTGHLVNTVKYELSSDSSFERPASNIEVTKDITRHDAQYSQTPRAHAINIIENERSSRATQIHYAKRAEKTVMENGSFVSDTSLQNLNALYSSSSETELKTPVEARSDDADGLEFSDNHYEEVIPLAACASLSHPPPSLPQRRVGGAVSENPDPSRARSLPPIRLSQNPVHQSCQNGDHTPSPPQPSSSEAGAEADWHPLSSDAPGEVGGARGWETQSSDGRKKRPSKRSKGKDRDSLSPRKSKDSNCSVM